MMNIERTEQEDLFKVGPGSFVVRNNRADVLAYRSRVKAMEQKEHEMEQMRNEINNINKDLSDIKGLLQLLVQKADK